MTVTLADVPTYDAFMWPIVERLRAHGRSLSNAEMLEDVAQHMGLGDDILSLRHGKLNQFAVYTRMAFARSFLKQAGAVENSQRGVWSLTPAGAAMAPEEVAEIPRRAQREYVNKRAASLQTVPAEDHPDIAEAVAEQDWKAELIARLQQIEPAAFERLCQRLLREFGFVKVEVTGKSGDGGIDGTGVLRINLLSFHVLFQCKRYSGSVGSGAVRDFRGAMVGRTDKGLILTTGTFTADARREATRDGAPAIDLVDGDALCDLLKDRGLGVTVRMVEEVTVNESAFADF